MDNDTRDYRISDLENRLEKHEDGCNVRHERTERRFDNLDKRLTRLEVIVAGAALVVQPLIAVLIRQFF